MGRRDLFNAIWIAISSLFLAACPAVRGNLRSRTNPGRGAGRGRGY